MKCGIFNFDSHLCNTTATTHKGKLHHFSTIIKKGPLVGEFHTTYKTALQNLKDSYEEFLHDKH